MVIAPIGEIVGTAIGVWVKAASQSLTTTPPQQMAVVVKAIILVPITSSVAVTVTTLSPSIFTLQPSSGSVADHVNAGIYSRDVVIRIKCPGWCSLIRNIANYRDRVDREGCIIAVDHATTCIVGGECDGLPQSYRYFHGNHNDLPRPDLFRKQAIVWSF